MNKFTPWNSRPLNEWAQKYAKGKFIDLDGKSTHYIEKGEGKPLILIHGFFYDSFTWHNNIDLLAEHFKVYALDLWGFGDSDKSKPRYEVSDYVALINNFTDNMGIREAPIVGHALGASIALEYAARYPDRAKKVMAVSLPITPDSISRKLIDFANNSMISRLWRRQIT